jgi:hypothetical protein
MCHDETIKELLPVYLEQALKGVELQRVEEHLATCKDCGAELALLRAMLEDTVPDPGEAFWNQMPGRVYRAVQQEQARKKHFDLSWLLGSITLPRWAFTAATAGLVLLIAWFSFQAPQSAVPTLLSSTYEFTDEFTAAGGPVRISELNQDELDSVALWAGKEFAAISQEIAPVMAGASETDIYDELGDLDSREAEQFAAMLDQWNEEG